VAAQFGVAAVVGDDANGSFVRVLVLFVLWLRVHHVFFSAKFYLKKSTADGQNVYPVRRKKPADFGAATGRMNS
jgi:hypothetical protein